MSAIIRSIAAVGLAWAFWKIVQDARKQGERRAIEAQATKEAMQNEAQYRWWQAASIAIYGEPTVDGIPVSVQGADRAETLVRYYEYELEAEEIGFEIDAILQQEAV